VGAGGLEAVPTMLAAELLIPATSRSTACWVVESSLRLPEVAYGKGKVWLLRKGRGMVVGPLYLKELSTSVTLVYPEPP